MGKFVFNVLTVLHNTINFLYPATGNRMNSDKFPPEKDEAASVPQKICPALSNLHLNSIFQYLNLHATVPLPFKLLDFNYHVNILVSRLFDNIRPRVLN